MEFRILGPLEVWDGRGEVSLGGPKPRALLAVLLLDPGEVVPTDRLIDELWGEDSPERAGREVEKARGAGPLYVPTTRSPGYVIRVEPDMLDLHRFERLVDEGRSLRARLATARRFLPSRCRRVPGCLATHSPLFPAHQARRTPPFPW